MSDTPTDSTWTPEPRSDDGDDGRVADRAIDGRAFALHGVVVQYDGRPDRCTIYPRRKSCRDRMELWLSANQDAFVCLESNR
jgi:hypothetical protein